MAIRKYAPGLGYTAWKSSAPLLSKSETFHVITKTASPFIWSTHQPKMYHTKTTKSCCGDPSKCSGLRKD